MSELPGKSEAISNKVVDLLVNNAFRKNGVDIESLKGRLLDEQKKEIKELVEELTQQVEAFVQQKPRQ